MQVSYDEEADVLYIQLRECESSDTEHLGDGVLVSRDMDTGEIVGYTIMYFSEKNSIELPGTEDIQVPA